MGGPRSNLGEILTHLGKPLSDLGKRFYDLGKHLPDMGKLLSNIGKTFSNLGKRFADIGKSNSKTVWCLNNIRKILLLTIIHRIGQWCDFPLGQLGREPMQTDVGKTNRRHRAAEKSSLLLSDRYFAQPLSFA
jgi:hypothetical protein